MAINNEEAVEIEKMKEQINDFGRLANELYNIFEDLAALKITAFITKDKKEDKTEINPKIEVEDSLIYLNIHPTSYSEQTYNIKNMIILLQTALEESGIINQNKKIHPFLHKFLLDSHLYNKKETTLPAQTAQKGLNNNFSAFIEMNEYIGASIYSDLTPVMIFNEIEKKYLNNEQNNKFKI